MLAAHALRGYKAPADARMTLQPKLDAVKAVACESSSCKGHATRHCWYLSMACQEALKDDAECDYVLLKDTVDVTCLFGLGFLVAQGGPRLSGSFGFVQKSLVGTCLVQLFRQLRGRCCVSSS